MRSPCPTLFEKSGAEGEYRRFKFELLKLAKKDALPGYALSVEPGKGGGAAAAHAPYRRQGRIRTCYEG